MSSQAAASTPKRDRLRALFSSSSRSRSHSPSASISSVTNITNTFANTSLSPPPSTASQSTASTQLPAVAPSQHTNVSITPSSSFIASTSPGNVDIFAQAFSKLSASESATLRPLINPTTPDIGQAVAASLTAAKQKQRDFQSRRWVFTFAGHTITLREEADKIVRWLDRFKSVGDIVVNVDPMHAGLPWAGIRLLLELAVSDYKQLESLLVGCETTLYMMNRLQVYMDFLSRLPTCLTRNNFEVALIEMYSLLLAFLAKAIHVYQQSMIQRISTSFWHENEVTNFEQNCDRLAKNLEVEASNCDRMLGGHDRDRLQQLHQALSQALLDLQQIRSVQASLDRIERKIDRSRLRVVEPAMFNAYNQTHNACHKATRVDLLQSIYSWAQQSTSKSIFWLNGAAGSGKSTIAWTVAKYLIDHSNYGLIDMGGSFFFKRGEGDRGRAEFLFPTIAYQLAMKLDGLDTLVTQAIDADPSICSKSLSEQFKKLIREPLEKLATDLDRPTYIIVIDALDECEVQDIATVLQLWSELPNFTNVSLRLFLTSRPDLPVLYGFDEISVTAHLDVDLQEETRLTTRHDLTLFLRDSFNEMRDKYNRRPLLGLSLDPGWPGEATINELVEMAYPLFIVARTVCLFVGDSRWDPTDRLTSILGSRKTGQLSQMAQTYLPVLQHLTQPVSNFEDKDLLCSEFRHIIGAVITLAEPLSIEALAALLDVPNRKVARKIQHFRSVLEIPPDLTTPIRPLHLSFGEFLTSIELQNGPFGIDSQIMHSALLQQCLKLLSSPGPDSLHEDLCSLHQPGRFRKELAPGTVENRISPAMKYACQYWPHHVLSSGIKVEDESEVHAFLKAHFLHWLEALSLLDRLADAIGHLAMLQSSVSATNSATVSSFLEDARRFTLSFRAIGDIAPLQLYSSATIFSPQTSVVRVVCGNVPAWIPQHPVTPAKWSSELQKLEAPDFMIELVTFSPDGLLLATASSFGPVRIWNTSTGQEIQQFVLDDLDEYRFHSPKLLAFSSDAALLAVVTEEQRNKLTLQLWNISSGQEVQKFERLSGSFSAAAFTLNGVFVAYRSDSDQRKIFFKNMTTGQELQQFDLPQSGKDDHDKGAHWDRVAVFSLDLSLFAAEFEEGRDSRSWRIQVWKTKNYQKLQQFHTHANCLAISPDNLLLASASDDFDFVSKVMGSLVCIWDIHSGQMVRTFKMSGRAKCMDFSPNGFLLCMGTEEGLVWVMNVNNDQEPWLLEGHISEINSLAFSPDSKIIASGCSDRTIRLWSVVGTDEDWPQTGVARTAKVSALEFSYDGSLLASACSDKILQVWCARSGRVLKSGLGHDEYVENIEISPDHCWLASITMFGAVQIWNIDKEDDSPQIYDFGNNVNEYVFESHSLTQNPVLFSPDSKLLAAASGGLEGSTLRIWSVGTKKELQMAKSIQRIHYFAFSPDSTALRTEHGYHVQIGPPAASEEVVVGNLDDIAEVEGFEVVPPPSAFGSWETQDRPDIVLDKDWISHRGERLLWLPHEYRGLKTVRHDGTFAFALPGGRVEVLTIGPPYSSKRGVLDGLSSPKHAIFHVV